MRDITLPWLLEDTVVYRGEADNSTKIVLQQSTFHRQICERYRAFKRYLLSNFEAVNRCEGSKVGLHVSNQAPTERQGKTYLWKQELDWSLKQLSKLDCGFDYFEFGTLYSWF